MRSAADTPLELDEASFQARVIDLARLCSWKIAHFRPANTGRGWRTPMQGDVGWPDLFMTRRGKIIAWELKSDKGKVRPEQQVWLDELANGGIEAAVRRPKDWDAIVAALR